MPLQLIGVLGRSDRGEPVQVASMIFLGILAAVAGTLGALAGARRSAGRRT